MGQKDSTTDVNQALYNTQLDKNDTTNPTKGLMSLIGKNTKEVKDKLGKPKRVDLSYYGYDWWIYNKNHQEYVQIGIENGKVVTVFAIGDNVNITPFKIGQSMEDIYSTHVIDTNVSLKDQDSTYQFELSEEDIITQPLTIVGNIFVQLYIDKFTGTLSSIRLMDASTLIKLHPFKMIQDGKEVEVPIEKKVNDEKIDRDHERQIFDIANVIRSRFHLNRLEWDENASNIAYETSQDMYENRDLSRAVNENGELLDVIEKEEGNYSTVRENIAANYMDAPAAVEGWFNSTDHRENLLNEDYTHTGIGVYKKFYIQDYIQYSELGK
jgi:uncharacterized protein YkwD